MKALPTKLVVWTYKIKKIIFFNRLNLPIIIELLNILNLTGNSRKQFGKIDVLHIARIYNQRSYLHLLMTRPNLKIILQGLALLFCYILFIYEQCLIEILQKSVIYFVYTFVHSLTLVVLYNAIQLRRILFFN